MGETPNLAVSASEDDAVRAVRAALDSLASNPSIPAWPETIVFN